MDEIGYLCSTCNIEGYMSGREESKKFQHSDSLTDRFAEKTRLNLNDLLKRRSEEEKIDKKTNLIVYCSVAAVGAVVLLILNL